MSSPKPRSGDTVFIAGNYQAKALTEGFIVQRFWHQQKIRLVERCLPPLPGIHALDLGCGSGVLAHYLALRQCQVWAVDSNAEAIEYAKSCTASQQMHFICAPFAELSLPHHHFDQVYCLEVIEHLDYPQVCRLLATIAQILRPGGKALLSTPNYYSFWPVIEWTMDHLRLAPTMDRHQHITRFHCQRLRQMIKGSNLTLLELGRFCGLAPFSSLLGWQVAEYIDRVETHMKNPFGNLLYAVAQSSPAK